MKILTFSSIYPNNIDPTYGIYVERRLHELTTRTGLHSNVIAPVPWFPFRSKYFGRYGALAQISAREIRQGTSIEHPRYPVVPKIGMNIAPWLMFNACRQIFKKCTEQHSVELIDAHYFYPDGVAASLLARERNIPFIISARGSDINVLSQYSSPRKQMLKAAAGASALIAVSEALAQKMRDIGMPREKIHVLGNGVDLDFFSPATEGRKPQPESAGVTTFVSAGALKAAKGHDIAIQFVSRLPNSRLIVAGSGPDESGLRRLVAGLGIEKRVVFAGSLGPEALREWYRAADALILMSEREGMPNVILESLACGVPVLATPVGGIPEILTDELCGDIVHARTADGLAQAWERVSRRNATQQEIRKFAMRFSWTNTVEQLYRIMLDTAGRT